MVAIVNRWQVKLHLGNLARAIAKQRGSETLYHDDGSRYYPIDPGDRPAHVAIIGPNFVLGTVRS